MATIVTSATAISDVNQALFDVLKTPLEGVDIRFDLPEIDSTQSSPTLSIFLYDVHEDLQLRQSEPARLNVVSSALRAGWVNLNCNYLITYWEAQSTGGDGDGPDSTPNNQAVQVITLTLQALLNNRELSGIAGAWSRIIPPQENLHSLGNFWQALGNRPRLSLVYSVTVPILLDNSQPQTLVKTVSSEIVQTANVDLKALNARLWQMLCQALGSEGEQKLARVRVSSRQQATQDDDGSAIATSVEISGIVARTSQEALEKVFASWSDTNTAVTEINAIAVRIVALEKSDLVYL